MANISTVVDDFEDGVFDTAKWYRSSGTNVLEQNGRIEIDATGDILLTVLGTTYNFDDIYFKISGDFRVILQSPAQSDWGYVFNKSGSSLRGGMWNGGIFGDTTVTYNAVSMAYLRFWNNGGNAEMWYSADASTWTKLAGPYWPPTQPGVDPSAMRIRFLSISGITYLESVNVFPVVPPTTVTLTGTLSSTALAPVPTSVGAPPITTINAVVMTVTARAVVPSLLIGPVIIGAPMMTTTALAAAPSVDTTAVSPPTVRSIGNSVLPAGWQVGDILLWIVFNSTGDSPTPAGYTEVSGSPQSYAHAIGLQAFWKRATAGETHPTYTGSTLRAQRMMAISGCPAAGNPLNASAGTLDNTSAGPMSVTTTDSNCLIVGVMHTNAATLGSGEFGSPTNANLTDLQERYDNDSGGKGQYIGTGIAASAGETGTWTVPRNTVSDGTLYITLALTSKVVAPVTITIPAAAPATALAPIPTVDAHRLPVLVSAEVSNAVAAFLIPLVSLPATTIAAEDGSGTASFPSPIAAGEQDFPLVKPMRAYALMILPEGSEPTSPAVGTLTNTASFPAPVFMSRPVLDTWQIHDEFEGTELSEQWVVGYDAPFLQPEGPGGPAPTQPLDQVPFISDGVMTLRTGTMLMSRDWLTFGEWAFRIEMEPIASNSEVIVAMALMAAFPQDGDFCGYSFPYTPGCPVRGMPYTKEYERQMDWYTYTIQGRRYVSRGWGVYEPYWDDSGGFEYSIYDPETTETSAHTKVILTSPHVRNGQNIAHYDSGDMQGYGGQEGGFMPYWPMEGGHDNRYAARPVRLVVQVTGPPGETVTITGINLTTPATKIVIPTAQLSADVGKVVDHTWARPYQGKVGDRRLRPPVTRTTARFPVPPVPIRMTPDPMKVDWADFLWPEWAGTSRPVTVVVPDAVAFASFTPPILFGEPVDVVIEVPVAASSGRMLATTTSGTIKLAFGIARSETRKMDMKIEYTKMDLGIGLKGLVAT